MLAFLLIIALLNVPAFFAPSAPVEPPPEPPPVVDVETIQADASKAMKPPTLETVGGLVCVAVPAYAGFRLSRIGARRKRVIKTDNAAFVSLMRKLETMSLILESVTNSE